LKRLLVVAVSLMVVVCGCGKKEASAPGPPPSPQARTKALRFALCPKNLNNAYWRSVEEGMKEKAKELGVEAKLVAPVEADAAKQVSMIEGVISRCCDDIGIAPNDPDSVAVVISEGIKKGIPVITFDADAPESERICYVGTDNHAAGQEAGKAMAKELGGKGKVIIITGGLGALNLNQRTQGFVQEATKAGLKVVGKPLPCNDDMTVADRLVDDSLRAHPDLNGIYCTGPWTYAAGNIVKNAGKAGKIKVVGFDTLENELQLVKEGAIQALIGQRPREMGIKSVEILYGLANGRKPDRKIIGTGIDVVTKDNVDQFLKKS
jgi:ribose transport system substrate-binding protein